MNDFTVAEKDARVCFACDAWIPGGMCRRIRISKHHVLHVSDDLNTPLDRDHDYTYPPSDFGCVHFHKNRGIVVASPGGFVFGSPWNISIGGKLFALNVDDRHKIALFELCDFLNERLRND